MELTHEAFWTVCKPEADVHFYVHQMRTHPHFISERAFVPEYDGQLIGNTMYTKAWLEDENSKRREILSFGPLCIVPEYKGRNWEKY